MPVCLATNVPKKDRCANPERRPPTQTLLFSTRNPPTAVRPRRPSIVVSNNKRQRRRRRKQAKGGSANSVVQKEKRCGSKWVTMLTFQLIAVYPPSLRAEKKVFF